MERHHRSTGGVWSAMLSPSEYFGGYRSESPADHLPAKAAMMIYEPLTLGTRMIVDTQSRAVLAFRDNETDLIRERFVLTRHAEESPFATDTTYAENSGFRTAGQLSVGGSGSPVLFFDQDGFHIAGHQVSYGSVGAIEKPLDGELNFDGTAVHVRHVRYFLKVSKLLP